MAFAGAASVSPASDIRESPATAGVATASSHMSFFGDPSRYTLHRTPLALRFLINLVANKLQSFRNRQKRHGSKVS